MTQYKSLSDCYKLAVLLFSALSILSCQQSSHVLAPGGKVLWSSSFEQGGLDDFNYILHPQGISISDAHASDGKYAAKVTVLGSDDYLWQGNPLLNRSELQYQPSTILEGGKTHIQFSFMLEDRFSNKAHEIAYFESNRSYQQLFRYSIIGDSLFFESSRDKKSWSLGIIKPKTWYRLDIQVNWSSNNRQGAVLSKLNRALENTREVQKATPTHLEVNNIVTLVKGEAAFLQAGILRRQAKQPATLWLDDFKELAIQSQSHSH